MKVDTETKLILKSTATPAHVHDSQEVLKLVDSGDKVLHANSTYTGEEIVAKLQEMEVLARINEKGTVAIH